jgi:hypothetical protein
MVNVNQIREHMMVHSNDDAEMNGVRGHHVGTVDHVDDGMIKLTKNDSKDGLHHMIPLSWVESVEGGTIHLSKGIDEIMSDWKAAS